VSGGTPPPDFPGYWKNLYDRAGSRGRHFPKDQWAQRSLAAAGPGGGDAYLRSHLGFR
jgi:hypothetical protein